MVFAIAFHIVRGDASIKLCTKSFNAGELKKVIMPDDGIPVDFDKLEK